MRIINVPRWIVPFVVLAALFSTADALVSGTEHKSTEVSSGVLARAISL